GRFLSRALVVGTNEQSKTVARLFHAPHTGIRIVGFLDDDLPPGTTLFDGIPVLGSPRSVRRVVEDLGVDQIIVVRDALAWESFQEILEETSFIEDGVEVKMLPGFQEILMTGVEVQHTGFIPLLALDRVRIVGIDALLKGILDYAVSAALLVALAPVALAVAAALPLLGPGPILERTWIVGRRGERFARLRFNVRDRLSGQSGWRRALAHVIERWRLALIPQLVNVLRGQMSLVGPRPTRAGREHRVRQWLPNLMSVKPGLTGPWAVAAGARGSLPSEMRGTMYYVRNYSIWLDLEILFHSLRRLIRRPPQASLTRSRALASERAVGTLRALARSLTAELPIRLCSIALLDERQESLTVAVAQCVGPGAQSQGMEGVTIGLAAAPLHRLVVENGQTFCFERSEREVGSPWPELPA
ncbi:MAG: sugar transferase, partial [Thermomicrobiaceae bacterium]|nr:sugar transferase [Thermomicrobiaceae bacterium]